MRASLICENSREPKVGNIFGKNWRETNLKKKDGAGPNLQGRIVPQAAPGKGFSGAAKGTSHPWKTHFQGRVKTSPVPENPF